MYLRKGQGIYVVVAVSISDKGIYYHCAGAAVGIENAIKYTMYYEQHLQERGYELVEAIDELEYANHYESIWQGDNNSQTFVKIQKSALME